MTAHKIQSIDTVPDNAGDSRSKLDVLVGIATFFLFASVYFIPKPVHSSIFYVSLVVLAAATWPRLAVLARANIPFLGLIAFFVVATIANGYGRSIPVSVLGRNLASVVTVPFFCLIAIAVCERIGWRMFRILLYCAVIAAAIAFGAYVWENGSGFLAVRFDAPGTGRNAIQFAGLMAGGIIVAAIDAADNANSPLGRIGNAACAFILLVLCLLSGSRGPVIAMMLIALVAWLFHARKRGPNGRQLLVMAACAWAVVTAVVLSSLFLEKVYCPLPAQFCRPGERVDIWSWVIDQVRLYPWLGNGADFRFVVEGKWHAHNGIWGLFMAFGIPAALVWLFAVSRLVMASEPAGHGFKCGVFAALMLIYGFAYMGSDLPNPFAYVGVHYIFLWLPLALLLPSDQQRPAGR